MMLNKSIDDSIEYIMMLCWGRRRILIHQLYWESLLELKHTTALDQITTLLHSRLAILFQ